MDSYRQQKKNLIQNLSQFLGFVIPTTISDSQLKNEIVTNPDIKGGSVFSKQFNQMVLQKKWEKVEGGNLQQNHYKILHEFFNKCLQKQIELDDSNIFAAVYDREDQQQVQLAYNYMVWEINMCHIILDEWVTQKIKNGTKSEGCYIYKEQGKQHINQLLKQCLLDKPKTLRYVQHVLYIYSTFAQYCFLPKCIMTKLLCTKLKNHEMVYVDDEQCKGYKQASENDQTFLELVLKSVPIVHVANTSLAQLFLYFIYLCKIHKIMHQQGVSQYKSYNIFICLYHLPNGVQIPKFKLSEDYRKLFDQNSQELIDFSGSGVQNFTLDQFAQKLGSALKIQKEMGYKKGIFGQYNKYELNPVYAGSDPQFQFQMFSKSKILQFCNFLDLKYKNECKDGFFQKNFDDQKQLGAGYQLSSNNYH